MTSCLLISSPFSILVNPVPLTHCAHCHAHRSHASSQSATDEAEITSEPWREWACSWAQSYYCHAHHNSRWVNMSPGKPYVGKTYGNKYFNMGTKLFVSIMTLKHYTTTIEWVLCNILISDIILISMQHRYCTSYLQIYLYTFSIIYHLETVCYIKIIDWIMYNYKLEMTHLILCLWVTNILCLDSFDC